MNMKFFSSEEIKSVSRFHVFRRLKKLVTFVPEAYVELLTEKLSKAGAGVLGNYDSCSFRCEGTGTFRPGSKSTPFSGVRNKLSSEREFRLEMECREKFLNKIIDELLKNHPYEEVAYEIYEFIKRDKNSSGDIVVFKRPLSLGKILQRLSRKKIDEHVASSQKFRKIVMIDCAATHEIVDSAKLYECDLVVSNNSNQKSIALTIIN
jgi:hypothetical protein